MLKDVMEIVLEGNCPGMLKGRMEFVREGN